MEQEWEICGHHGSWLRLVGHSNAAVRRWPSPNGKHMWQFRKTVSYASTVSEAKEYVEAAAEFFDVMRRNPYGT